MTNKEYSELKDLVNNYPTKHREGFITSEIKQIFKHYYPQFTLKQFGEKLGVHTGMLKDGDSITYHCDVLTALSCLIEARNISVGEWD